MVDYGPERKQFLAESVEYLESKEVYDLFDYLTKQLVINQPVDPITFLITKLKEKPPVKLIVVGPPGLNRSAICKFLSIYCLAQKAIAYVYVVCLSCAQARRLLRLLVFSTSIQASSYERSWQQVLRRTVSTTSRPAPSVSLYKYVRIHTAPIMQENTFHAFFRACIAVTSVMYFVLIMRRVY
jgi:Cdc6-like AAA superfamily ATPase